MILSIKGGDAMQKLRAKAKGDRAARRASRQRLLAAEAGEQGTRTGNAAHCKSDCPNVEQWRWMLALRTPSSA